MPKDYFQDVTPPNANPSDAPAGTERTIRNIPIRERRERPRESERISIPTLQGLPHSVMWFGNFPWRRLLMWAIIALAVIGLLFATVSMFKSTSVVITPRTHPLVLTEDVPLTAYQIGRASCRERV